MPQELQTGIRRIAIGPQMEPVSMLHRWVPPDPLAPISRIVATARIETITRLGNPARRSRITATTITDTPTTTEITSAIAIIITGMDTTTISSFFHPTDLASAISETDLDFHLDCRFTVTAACIRGRRIVRITCINPIMDTTLWQPNRNSLDRSWLDQS